MGERIVFRRERRLRAWALSALALFGAAILLIFAFEGPARLAILLGAGLVAAVAAMFYRHTVTVDHAAITEQVTYAFISNQRTYSARDVAAIGLGATGRGRHSRVLLDVRLRPDYRQLILEESPAADAKRLADQAELLSRRMGAPVEVDDNFELALDDSQHARQRKQAYLRAAARAAMPATFVLGIFNFYLLAVREGADLPFALNLLSLYQRNFSRSWRPGPYIEAISSAAAVAFCVLAAISLVKGRRAAARSDRSKSLLAPAAAEEPTATAAVRM